MYAAAVILPFGVELPYLNDSKQVTPRRREILFEQIKEQALAWSVSWVEPEEIDQIDILNSRIKAMKQAAEGPGPGGRLPAGGWQPGPRQPLCHSDATRDGGEGGQPLSQHRRGIHFG